MKQLSREFLQFYLHKVDKIATKFLQDIEVTMLFSWMSPKFVKPWDEKSVCDNWLSGLVAM